MSKELRMCFVGDSLLLGTNDDNYLGWPGRLCQRERETGHDVSLYNLGIRADTSKKIAARWRHECQVRLPETSPGALVFSFGANDCADLGGGRPARTAGTVHRCGPRHAGVGGRMETNALDQPSTSR